jgi:hypothetical protein
MRRPIPEKLIRETFDCFEGTRIEKAADGWTLITPWGRKVAIHDFYIDFVGITKLLPGEKELDREQLQFELENLAMEAWGCVDIRKVPHWERAGIYGHAKAYGILPVDDNAFRPFGIVDAKDSFGEATGVGNNWFPVGWRITVPGIGFVVIGQIDKELCIRKIDGDLYEATLRFLQERQGYAVVRGKLPVCTTWVTHGEMLGIKVIPEIPRGLLWFYLFGHITTIVLIIVAWLMFTTFPFINGWIDIGIGWIAAAIVMSIAKGSDRKRGDVLLNKFPQAASRNAKLQDARAKGML